MPRRLAVLAALLAALAAPAPGAAAGGPQAVHVSFKLDPRLAGPTYGGERWVAPPRYTGATDQRTVEARAVAVDAQGRPLRSTLTWSSSDPELVSIAPAEGAQVRLSVHRAGRGQVTVRAGEAIEVLHVSAARVAGAWQVSVTR